MEHKSDGMLTPVIEEIDFLFLPNSNSAPQFVGAAKNLTIVWFKALRFKMT